MLYRRAAAHSPAIRQGNLSRFPALCGQRPPMEAPMKGILAWIIGIPIPIIILLYLFDIF